MREVMISIESSEGAKMFIKKMQQEGGFTVEYWRARNPQKTVVRFNHHTEALQEMAGIAEEFVREIG